MYFAKTTKKFFIIFCLIASVALLSFVKKKYNHIDLSVMTFNIENGGAQVDFDKVVEAVKKAGADVLGIQEAWGNTAKLAKALGWQYYDLGQHIISRLPILVPADAKGLYVFIEVQPGKVVALANMHLPDEPYGPDLVKQGVMAAEVLENGQRVRMPTAMPFVNKLAALQKQGVPVFIVGDFNSPSQLDWTESTVNLLANHRYAVVWPVSKFIADKGFIDSYRQTHPNILKHPGYTWPAGRPALKNTADNFNPSKDDLPERIDFIFTAGQSSVISSQIVGEAGGKQVDVAVHPWPSDHRAIVSRFKVRPAILPSGLKILPAAVKQAGNVSIKVEPNIVKSGQPFTITWSQAPGNRFDYIRISPVGSHQFGWGEAVRLYTHAEIDGAVQYNAKNTKGNWLAWHVAALGYWPLKPGVYDVRLMVDDGFSELAATQIRVIKS